MPQYLLYGDLHHEQELLECKCNNKCDDIMSGETPWFTEHEDFWHAVFDIDSYEDWLVDEEVDEMAWVAVFQCRHWGGRSRPPFRVRADSKCLPEPRAFHPVCESGHWVEPTSSDIYGCGYPLRQGSQALTLEGNDVETSEFQDHNAAQLWVFNRNDPYQIWASGSMQQRRKGWKALGGKDLRGCGTCWKDCVTERGVDFDCDDFCKDPCGLKIYTTRSGPWRRYGSGQETFRATTWQLSTCSEEENKCALSLRAMQNEFQGWQMPNGLELLPTFYLSLKDGPRLVTRQVNKFSTGQNPMFELKDDVPITTFGGLGQNV